MIENRIVATGTANPDELLANPRNWRTHPEEQQQALDAVLSEVGWVQNVVVNRRTGRLVDGHLRVALAKRRREEEIPVAYVDLDEAEEAKILATIDPVAGMAGTDQELLDRLLQDVTTEDPALQALLDELGSVEEDEAEQEEDEEPDELPEPPAKPVTVPGDVWTLGDHRLVCGDSTAAEALEKLLAPGERADMIFTDPPYAIYGSSTGIAADITDDKMVRPFFRDIIANCAALTKPFGHVYICCDWRSWASWWEVAKGTGIAPKNMIVWDKGGAGLGSNYANTHELLLFASNMPMREGMSQKITGMRSVFASNLWRINRAGRDETGEKRQHNAQKPLALMETAIEHSTDPGQVVIDFFGGSGSTLIACERTGRSCRTMEIEPRWCDLIVTRWQEKTGRKAVDQNGESFDDRRK